MNAAPSAFMLIEQALLDDVQLTLAKLVDKSSGTAGLHALSKALRPLQPYREWTKAEFDPQIAALATACREMITRRNTWIAHHARTMVDSAATKPRMNPARQEVEDALNALRLVMNLAHRRFGESEYAYEHIVLLNDGETLVDVVRSGILMEQLSREGKLPHAV